MKNLRGHYNGSVEGERLMNITKVYLQEIYFKRQDVFPFKKYVNRLKEAYNTLGELNNTKFEEQKGRTLIDHIMCLYYQVKSCMHTDRKYFKKEFSGA